MSHTNKRKYVQKKGQYLQLREKKIENNNLCHKKVKN